MYAELTKARLSLLVVVTAAVGFLLGSPAGVNWLEMFWQMFLSVIGGRAGDAMALGGAGLRTVDWLGLGIVVAGVGLAAAGTSALNQWMEVDRDSAMRRTANRPLPARHMSRNEAFFAGIAMVASGAALLYFLVNPLAGTLTLFTAAIYIFIYTPMKARSPLNTLVGAVCGAIPPLIGWAAAAGNLALGAWALAGILFIWQLPHFLALAWMYREDYERGGFRMLPLVDRSGELTSQVAVVTSLLLVPLGLMAVLALRAPAAAPGQTAAITSGFDGGLVYAALALVLGVLMIIKAVALYRQRSERAARGLFIASIIYLPLLLIALVLDQPRPSITAVHFQQTLVAAEKHE